MSSVLLKNIGTIVSGDILNPLLEGDAIFVQEGKIQKVGQEANPKNFLLMHAMGPNVAGVIGSAVAAGVLLSLFG